MSVIHPAELQFLDGAMGTMLQHSGADYGECPESLCLTAPQVIRDIHTAYLEAGSRILYSCTFGSNRYKLAGTPYSTRQLIPAAVALARQAAAPYGAQVALDIGPIGQLLEPNGTLAFEEAYDIFQEQIFLGSQAGADLIVIETMTDLYEVKAAVLAARETCDLPVFVTMTFEENGRTFTGCTPETMAMTLEGLGVAALGVNCSLGPQELLPIVQRLSRATALPLIVKANAGLPDPQTGLYHVTPEEYAQQLLPMVELGAVYLGGCCGTTPDFIRTLHRHLAGQPAQYRTVPRQSAVCSATRCVTIDTVRVIGERINPTGKKRFQQALRDGDLDYILQQAVQQADAGADILDVNVGLPGLDEAQLLPRVVKRLQAVVDLPLQLDSVDPRALENALRVYNGKAIVNSVNGEDKVLDAILPLVKRYGAAVIGLTLDENGIPPIAEERVAIAKKIIHAAETYGIPREDVFIDCLTLTVSAEQDKAVQTLRAVETVTRQLGVQTTLGVSNISFGLPNRELITASFLTMAMRCGLRLPIVNPNSAAIMDAIAAYRVLANDDPNAQAYIARFAAAPAAPAAAPAAEMEVEQAIAKGLGAAARQATQALLAKEEPMDIVNHKLIPALDRVGDDFEAGKIFLPQLIQSAAAAQEAFEAIRVALAKAGGQAVNKGKIILATVQGDIHDIGKNIVKVILENYGYQILDLGRDVPPEKVVQTAIDERVSLIGLSALMTTTLPSMERTIRALRESGHPCQVFVGGAVLTPEYAKEIGADFYAKDAKQSADIAKRILG